LYMSYGTNASQGLQLSSTISSATLNGSIREYPLALNYGSNLFNGDPVYAVGDGTIAIAVAGVAQPILGVFLGVKYYSPIQGVNGNFVFSPYWLAGTQTLVNFPGAMALVSIDPNQLYNIQVSGAIAATDINNNADLIAGAGSLYSGKSGWMLD